MATKIPIQGIIRINDKEVRNTYWGIRNEMTRVEKELKKLTRGTDEYEKKSKELEVVSKKFHEVNNEIKAQKGYLRSAREESDSFNDSVSNLREGFSALARGDFSTFSAMVTNGFSSMKNGARSFFLTLMSNPITALIAILAGLGIAIFKVTNQFIDYNNTIAPLTKKVQEITQAEKELANQIRNRATAMEKSFGKDFESNVKAADQLVKAFGVTYQEAFDMIEDGIIKGADANGEFFDSIEEYNVFFEQAGYSAQEFIDIINAGVDLNVYKDKLQDAIKEAGLSLNEQSKATRDALTNAFGASFTDDLLARVRRGQTTVKEALEEISVKAEEANLDQQQLGQLTADIFRGAGEDVGGAAKVFQVLNKAVKDSKRPLTELEQETKKLAESTRRLQNAKDAFFASDDLQRFLVRFRTVWTQIQSYAYSVLSFLKKTWGQTFSDINRLLNEFGITTGGVFNTVKKLTKGFVNSFLVSFKLMANGVTNVVDTVLAFRRSFIKEIANIVIFLKSAAPEFKKLLVDFFTPGSSVDISQLKAIYKRFANQVGNSYFDELKKIKDQRKIKELLGSIPDLPSSTSNNTINDDDDGAFNNNTTNNSKEKIDINGQKALSAQEEWAKKLQDAKRKNWDELHAIDEEGMQKEIDQIREQTARKLQDIDRENQEIINKRAEINAEIKRLQGINGGSAAERAEIESSISAYRDSLEKMNEILEINTERKKSINETGEIEINTIKERYILENIQTQRQAFEEEQRLAKLESDLAIENLRISEQDKERLRKEFQQKQLAEQSAFLDHLKSQLQLLQETGDFDALNLQDIILSKEGLELLKQNLAELGFSLKEIELILAKIKGGGAEDDFQGVGIIAGADLLGMTADQWEAMYENIDQWQGKVEMVVAVTQAMQQAWGTFHDIQMKREQERLRRFEQTTQRKKNALQEQLDQGYISQREYDAKVAQLEDAVEKRRAEMAYKQAKFEKKQSLISAITGTAAAVVGALGNKPWTPANFVLASVVGALGAAQIATIASQPLPRPTGYAKGGRTLGLGFKDHTGHEVAGVVHANEYVVPEWMNRDPVVANVIDWLEAKRTGNVAGFAQGGYTTQQTSPDGYREDTMQQGEYNQLMYGALLRFVDVMEKVDNDGLRAYIVANELEGKKMKKSIDSYDVLRNKNNR